MNADDEVNQRAVILLRCNEAQEPNDDALSAREEFIAPGRIPFHHFSG